MINSGWKINTIQQLGELRLALDKSQFQFIPSTALWLKLYLRWLFHKSQLFAHHDPVSPEGAQVYSSLQEYYFCGTPTENLRRGRGHGPLRPIPVSAPEFSLDFIVEQLP